MQLTYERLRELLSYDPETGVFTRLKSGGGMAVGSVSGHKEHRGYTRINIDRKLYRAHRLAWLYMTGAMPDGVIDHIDGDAANDRFINLRCVSQATNTQNIKRAPKHNAVGLLGAQQNHKGFQARITVHGVRHNLGTFTAPQDAHAAYLDAKRSLHQGNTL